MDLTIRRSLEGRYFSGCSHCRWRVRQPPLGGLCNRPTGEAPAGLPVARSPLPSPRKEGVLPTGDRTHLKMPAVLVVGRERSEPTS